MNIYGFFKRMHKKSIYISWMFSYMIIALVFIAGIFCTYFSAKSIILNEINSKSTYVLGQIQNNMNNIISDISNLGNEFMLNETITVFSKNRSPINGDRRYDASVISKLLNRYKLLHSGTSSILDIYIYIPELDFVLSTRTSTDTRSFYNMFFNNGDMSFDKWKNIVTSDKSIYEPVTSVSESGNEVSTIMFTKPLSSLQQQTNSYLVILVNSRSFIDKFERSYNDKSAHFYILDSDNRLICSSESNDLAYNELYYDKFPDDTGIFKNRKNVFAYTTDNLLSWKFISSIPSNVLFHNVSLLLKIQILLLCITLICIILLSVYFTKRHYMPISDIIWMIQLEDKASAAKPTGNEYEYIEKVLSQTFSEQKRSNNLIERQNAIIRDSYLQKLLHGYDKDLSSGGGISSLNFMLDNFVVCIYYIDNCSELFFEEGNDSNLNYKQAQFIISNVIFELMNKNHAGYILECDDMLTSIFNANLPHSEDITAEMNEIIAKAQQFAADNFNLYFSVASSSPYTGIDLLHTAYSEALSVMEFKIFTGNTDNLSTSDIQQEKQNDYVYSNILEQQLINSVKSSNVAAAEEIINEIINISFKQTTPTLSFIRYLIFDITSIIIKSVNAISTIYKQEFINNYNVINDLMNCKTIDEFKTEIRKTLIAVCGFIESKNELHEDKIEITITNYVSEHYNEFDLSIGSIADFLNLSPNYVSSRFKSQTGTNLLSYINNVRIEKSLELLKDCELKIKDISEQVGFANVRTFLSVFKKKMGITPTQYRENNM